MRWLLLFCILPFAAQADDLSIHASYVVRQERIRPSPKIVTPTIEHHFVLHENGVVDERAHTGGSFPKTHQSSAKLGEGLKVLDDRTIRRTWIVGAQIREM